MSECGNNIGSLQLWFHSLLACDHDAVPLIYVLVLTVKSGSTITIAEIICWYIKTWRNRRVRTWVWHFEVSGNITRDMQIHKLLVTHWMVNYG